MSKEPYLSIYRMLGFYPYDIRLYEQAFLHRSAGVERNGKWINNERLEFLGDAILDSIVADILYKQYPNNREGFLTDARAKIVQRDTLDRIAIELGIDKRLVYSIKLMALNKHLYGNALEALIAAIYLDRGYRMCFRFVNDVVIGRYMDLDKLVRKEINFKSSLLEWGQKNRLPISFNVLDTYYDNDKCPMFQTAVMLAEQQIGVGTGHSKKESHQQAARMAIKRLRSDKDLRRLIVELKREKKAVIAVENDLECLPDDPFLPEASPLAAHASK